MAIKLVQDNKMNEYIKLISIVDDAIDWDLSYPDTEKKEEDTSLEEAKKRVHIDERDYSRLVFKQGELPTVFVFRNPKILENNRKLSNVQLAVAGVGKQKAEACDLWYRTFDVLCVGTASNMTDDPVEIPRDKHTKMITKEVTESLSFQGIISEMAGILMSLNRDSSSKKK